MVYTELYIIIFLMMEKSDFILDLLLKSTGRMMIQNEIKKWSASTIRKKLEVNYASFILGYLNHSGRA